MVKTEIDYKKIGKNLYSLMEDLFPICRSITGNGVRETLKIIKKIIPVEIKEVPSGTKVFDWVIPKEWNIKDAYVKDSKGNKIIDFQKTNLHVMNYSIPIHKKIKLKELKPHLFTLPDHPDWIPYAHSYYKENWGFCLTHNQYKKLKEDTYEVFIDSTLKNGSLTYGEYYIKGKSKDEILFTCYICHPSLCNDSLSGVVLVTYLAKLLSKMKLKYSYRFLFIPETIGAITWLSQNEKKTKNIKYGLVATCLGDPGKYTYKKTRNGDTLIDKIVEKVLFDSKEDHQILDFWPIGSDERQFCSPGFNLNVGSLMRTVYGCFPQYHTSGDNLDFVDKKYLTGSFEKYMDAVYIFENNASYMNLNPKCEPQLRKRGFYDMAEKVDPDPVLVEVFINELLWVLNFSDGNNSILDIAIRSGRDFKKIKYAADALVNKKLLKKIDK